MSADFAFMMALADFHTAVRSNLPLTVFVFSDNAIGQEKLNPSYADIPEPDFAKLAVGFGAKGFDVTISSE